MNTYLSKKNIITFFVHELAPALKWYRNSLNQAPFHVDPEKVVFDLKFGFIVLKKLIHQPI
jgi:hypothetical protein